MKRVLGGLAVALLTIAPAGCSAAKPTTACTPKGDAVTICLNGKPIDFSTTQVQPHIHETGNLYAPVLPLAQALKVTVQVDAPHERVIVNGHEVKGVATKTFKGIHQHGDEVVVPIREFAQAAGLSLNIAPDGHTAGFAE